MAGAMENRGQEAREFLHGLVDLCADYVARIIDSEDRGDLVEVAAMRQNLWLFKRYVAGAVPVDARVAEVRAAVLSVSGQLVPEEAVRAARIEP